MKKTVICLFVFIVTIIFFYGMLVFRGVSINGLLSRDLSIILVSFDTENYNEEYNAFRDIVDEQGLMLIRFSSIEMNSFTINTTDISFGGMTSLISGVWPEKGTNEFVATFYSGEENQVGVIRDILPNFDITIRYLESLVTASLSGEYFISTSDMAILSNVLQILNENIYNVELIWVDTSNNIIDLIFMGGFTLQQVFEIATVVPFVFLCLFVSVIQYSISQLKTSAVFLVHGYSKTKLAKITTFNLLKALALASTIGFILFFIYGTVTGFLPFMPVLSLYFILACLALILFCIMILNISIFFYLRKINSTSIIKGKKPYFFVQTANHLIKFAFIVFLLAVSSFFINNITEIGHRLQSLESWEQAQNIHRGFVSYINLNDMAAELDLSRNLKGFFYDMVNEYQAFLIDSNNIINYDTWGTHDIRPESAERGLLHISPMNASITISMSYLEVNPIFDIYGENVINHLSFDPYTMNLLVPEALRVYEEYIIELYYQHFYFRIVGVDNIYNHELGLPLNTMTMDELTLNIIYVKDGQYYFSFNDRVRVDAGNKILDPIVSVFTGYNIHSIDLLTLFINGFYFYTDAIDVFNEVLWKLDHHNLRYNINTFVSVYEQHAMIIMQLREEYFRSMTLTVIIFLSSLVVTYSLISSYFQRNRQKLYLKSIFGYGVIKRNFYFLSIFVVYSLIAIVGMSIFLALHIFALGILMLIIDLILALLTERILLTKSFNEVMKGEG